MKIGAWLILAGCGPDYGLDRSNEAAAPLLDTAFEPDWADCEDPSLEATTVPMDPWCDSGTLGGFDPVVEWDRSIWQRRAHGTPVVAHLTDDNGNGALDADDIPDIVVTTEQGVFVVSGENGFAHGELLLDNDGKVGFVPAVGDVNADGWPDIVAVGDEVVAFDGRTRTALWRTQLPVLIPETAAGGVALFDLDGDNTVEVLVGSAILDGRSGAVEAVGARGQGGDPSGAGCYPTAADLDRDGVLEVIVGNAWYRPDGSAAWSSEELSGGIPAVGSFDTDDRGEVVVSAAGQVRLHDDDGSVLWTRGVPGTTSGPPTVVDTDGDDIPEIAIASDSTITVFDATGGVRWTHPISPATGGVGSTAFDFEGDGAIELVVADAASLLVFDAATGKVRYAEQLQGGTIDVVHPVIADVDGDGSAEIVISAGESDEEQVTGLKGLIVVGDEASDDDAWMPARPIWNQVAWAITHVDDFGTVTSDAEPSWLHHNTYRAAETSIGAGYDAAVELGQVCTDRCDEGIVEVIVRVANHGTLAVPLGTTLQLSTRTQTGWVLLEEIALDEPIQAGKTSKGLLLELDSDAIEGGLRVAVETEQADCRTTNDLLIADVTCGREK